MSTTTTTTTTTKSESVTPTQSPAVVQRAAPVKVSLNVTSDTICPWCYVGFKHINNAIQRAKSSNLPLTFEVEFSPFMLDPSLPERGSKPRWKHYIDKFGEARAAGIRETLGKVGKELGIDFKYDGPISQTTASHRILTKAFQVGGQDAQQKLLEIIFRGFFEENKDVGDLDWLAGCAEEAGFMSAEEAKKFLTSDELSKEVAHKIQLAQMMGITGVPFTIINGKWALSGAQPSEVFYQVFEKLAKDPRAAKGGANGHGKAEVCAGGEGGACGAPSPARGADAETCEA